MMLGAIFAGGMALGFFWCWLVYTFALAGYELRKGIESA
jgi:hypothetical protein